MPTRGHRQSLTLPRYLAESITAIGSGAFAISFHAVWLAITVWGVLIYSQIADLEKTPMFEDAKG